MATFTSSFPGSNGVANAVSGVLTNIQGGTLAELQDSIGDRFDLSFGDDIVIAGDGNDTINGGGGFDQLFGRFGDDTIDGGEGSDRLFGQDGNDYIDGAAGEDLLDGGSGNDTLTGFIGDDRIFTDAGQDVLDGGEGFDTIIFHKSMICDYLTGTYDFDIASDLWFNFEALQGASGEDFIRTTSFAFSVTLLGGGGNDTLITAQTNNIGNQLWGEAGNDTLMGGAGHDRLDGGTEDDVLYTDAGSDILIGGDGFDTIVFHKSMVCDYLTGTYDADIAGDTWQSFEVLQGASGADFIRTISFAAPITLLGGAGNDTLITAQTNNIGNTLMGEAGNDSLTGGAGSDSLDGGDGNDVLNGGAGIDQLRGGLGNDVYFVNAAGEADETGGGGIDTIRSTISWTLGAAFEHLTLLGGGNTNATGNALANQLTGNVGNNTLTGGLGRDVMTSDVGFDRFDFNATAESGLTAATRDIITDFNAGTNVSTIDRIDVSTIDAKTGIAGNQAFIFGGAFTAGHIRAVQSGANVILQFNTDADAAAEMTIQLNNVLLGNLNSGDFIL